MLIICDGCNSKIRVPDKAAGKRVKCPKCANMIKVPATDSSIDPETAGVSAAPLPPPPEPEPAEEEPAEEPTGTEVTSKPSSLGSKPPPIKKSTGDKPAWDKNNDQDDDADEDDDRKKNRSKRDDDDDDEDDRKKTRSERDDDDDDDDDDRRRKKRRKRDDDDSLDVGKKRARRRAAAPNNLALTAMITGIISAVFAVPACWPGCCCFVPGLLAIATGAVAVITGSMARGKPESDGMALTGIICGFVAIGCAVTGIVLFFVLHFLQIGLWGMQNF